MAIRSNQLPMCQLLLEKYHADCKVSPEELYSLARTGNFNILKLLVSNGVLERNFESFTWSLMTIFDDSKLYRDLEKRFINRELTIMLKKALEQEKEERVNVELVEYLLQIGAKIHEGSIWTIKEKCFSNTLKVIENFGKEKTHEAYHNQHFKETKDSIDKARNHCDNDKNYFGDRGNTKTKDEKMKELEKASFQYTVKKKLNERKARLSHLRKELAQFDDIENKILEERNKIKDLEERLKIAEYSVRSLLRKKRKMLERVDEFRDIEEDIKHFEAALVCHSMELDVNRL